MNKKTERGFLAQTQKATKSQLPLYSVAVMRKANRYFDRFPCAPKPNSCPATKRRTQR